MWHCPYNTILVCVQIGKAMENLTIRQKIATYMRQAQHSYQMPRYLFQGSFNWSIAAQIALEEKSVLWTNLIFFA